MSKHIFKSIFSIIIFNATKLNLTQHGNSFFTNIFYKLYAELKLADNNRLKYCSPPITVY